MKSLYEFGMFLKKRARWTHNIIERSTILRLGVMEETITDMHLFSVADEYNENVLTKKFNRREEGSTSGADWLWIIGKPGSWLPLLIQAKIINPQTQNCRYLNYKDGEQRRRLLQYARQHSFVPVYCVYSYVPPEIILPDRLIDDQDIQDWACVFLAPRTVRMLSKEGKKSQLDILKYGIPWMDPFCLLSSQDEFSGESVAKAIIEIRDNLEIIRKQLPAGRTSAEKNALQKRIGWENLDTMQALQKIIPPSICKWFTQQQTDYLDVPLSGASIISSAPIDQISELQG